MTESSIAAAAAAASPTPREQKKEEIPPALKALQDILHNRIKQKKEDIHESHSIVHNQNIWREVETLHWVLAKILTLKREYITLNSRISSNNNISREEMNQRRMGRRPTTVTTKK